MMFLSTLSFTLHIALHRSVSGCLTVCSQVSSQDALKHTTNLLYYMLTSKLSRCSQLYTQHTSSTPERGYPLAAIMILDYDTGCILNYVMHNPYPCIIPVVSNMLVSGSSYYSSEVWVLRSHLDTLRDTHDYHVRQLIVNMRLRGLFSPTCSRQALGGARSGLENSLNCSMT